MANHRDSEADLVRAAKRGSTDAAGALFDAHWGEAVGVGVRILGSTSAAEDVAADAFEVAFSKIGELRGSAFGPWLRRIIVNRALNELRREHQGLPDWAREDGTWMRGDFTTSDPTLVEAVRQLDPDRREAIFLRYWVDLSPDQIAEVLGVPVGTVNSRLARALAQLRAHHEVET
jgi:RNA polymerase sigma-70 factor (ECF subfamily)